MTVWLKIAKIVKNYVQVEDPCVSDDNEEAPVKDNAAARDFDKTADKDGYDTSASDHDDDDEDFSLAPLKQMCVC